MLRYKVDDRSSALTGINALSTVLQYLLFTFIYDKEKGEKIEIMLGECCTFELSTHEGLLDEPVASINMTMNTRGCPRMRVPSGLIGGYRGIISIFIFFTPI